MFVRMKRLSLLCEIISTALSYQLCVTSMNVLLQGVSIASYADALRVLVIAEESVSLSLCLSVCLSATLCYSSKPTQARITKSSVSAPQKTPLSESAKLLKKFKRGHPDRGR